MYLLNNATSQFVDSAKTLKIKHLQKRSEKWQKQVANAIVVYVYICLMYVFCGVHV